MSNFGQFTTGPCLCWLLALIRYRLTLTHCLHCGYELWLPGLLPLSILRYTIYGYYRHILVYISLLDPSMFSCVLYGCYEYMYYVSFIDLTSTEQQINNIYGVIMVMLIYKVIWYWYIWYWAQSMICVKYSYIYIYIYIYH